MTDNPVRRAPPRISLSGTEWKLFLVGGLGLAYAASLSAIATQAPADVAQMIVATAPVTQAGINPPRPSVGVATGPVPGSAVSAQTARAPRILTRTS